MPFDSEKNLQKEQINALLESLQSKTVFSKTDTEKIKTGEKI